MKAKEALSKALALVLAFAVGVALLFGSGVTFVSADSEADSSDGTVSTMSSSYSSYTFEGSGTESDPYLIGTVADLEGLATVVGNKENSSDTAETYFLLTADLTLPSDWTGIGGGSSGSSSSYTFKGIFDGGGHTITYDDFTTSATYVGLFRYIGGSSSIATVKNLTVTGSITASSASRCGGIAVAGYCSFENCVSDVDITVTQTGTSSTYTGGIMAYCSSSSASMTGCINSGDIVTSNRYAGGLAGYMSGTITNCLNTGSITNNYSGTSSSYYACVGGISAYGGSSSKFISCVNTGTVSLTTSSSYARISTMGAYSTSNETSCYSTYDLEANNTDFVDYDGDGVTYVSAFTLEEIWMLNTQGAEADNSYFWALDTETNMAVFADDENPAAVRVLYQLSDGSQVSVYTTVGSTAAAPEGYEEASFGDFVPNETIVIEDTTAVQQETITLNFYYDQSSTDESNLYYSMSAETGKTVELPDDPTREYYSFAGWVDADGNAFTEDDILTTDALFATWTPAYDSETETYTIATADALEWFAEQVNSGNCAINAVLANDIDASASEWTPIGSSSYEYTGTFDGAGYSIRISIEEGTSYAGLFREVGAGGVVKNLTVKGSVTGTTGAAGIACYNYGTITDCVNRADVSGGYYAGGISAYNGGTIINCGNEGDISAYKTGSASAQAGGIAGSFVVSVENDRYIYNCYNWGSVTAENSSTSSTYRASAGGIVGEGSNTTSSSSSGYNNYIQNCYSTGTLSAAGTYAYTGGIVACVVSASSSKVTTYISNCWYLSGTASVTYNSSSSSYDKGSESDVATFTESDYDSLLTSLNSVASTYSWTTWVADTTYDSKPAFRVSNVAEYTITFIGDYTGTLTVLEAGRVTLPEYTDDIDHYYAFTLDTADGETFSESTKIYEDLTLYVTKTIYTYTVTYDIGTGDSGSSVPDTVTYDSSSTVTVDFVTVPAKDGYTFTGWEDDDGNFYSEDGTTTFVITKDTTLTAVYQAYEFKGSGTEADPYQIDCVEALVAMAGLVTKGDTDYSTGQYYIQTADIDLTGVDWSPVGAMGTALESGSNYLTNSEYDGNGYSITGLSYDGSDSIAAIFAGLNNSTVKDLTVSGTITNSGKYSAGLVGYLYEGSVIDNCTVSVDVTATSSTSFVGGIVAWSTDASTISNCTYTGTLTGTYYTGGIVGYVSGGTTISNALSISDVTSAGSSALYAGGIAAYFCGTSSAMATIVNSGHQGTVTAAGYSSSVTAARAGGIVGYVGTSSYYAEIINSYHGTGAVSSTGYYAGGILGNAYSSHITIQNCYSAAESVTTGYTETYLPGGIIGGIQGSYTPTIEASYYNADGVSQAVGYLTSSSNSTDTSSVSTIDTAAGLAELLNTWVSANDSDGTYETWSVISGQNGGYPVFGTADESDDPCEDGHTAGEAVIENEVEATCTEDGSYDSVVYCTVCGEEISRETIAVAAAGHSYEAVVTEPTCTEDGYTTYTCSVCGDTYVADETDALGHTAGEAVIENEVEATCTEDGSYDSVVYCTVCGEEISREAIAVAAAGHSYEATVTEPTCTEDGYTTYTCSVCGDTYVADETDALGHTAGEAVIENEVEATCTEDGSYDSVVYCTVCGEEISREAIAVAAAGHSYEAVVTEPTCTEGGYTTYTCSVCGDSYITDETEALGHSYEAVTENGIITYTCTACGDSYIEYIVYTATFTVDGETVAVVEFTVADEELEEAEVPSKEGYVGIWSEYEIIAEDITIEAVYQLLGDVNGDGEVNSKDAASILRYIAETEELDALAVLAADVDGDGEVTAADAELILSAEDTDYQLLGDVDGDGEINTKDAILILRYIAGTEELDALAVLAADVDGDGEVTSADAVLVLRYAAGSITEF